MAKLYARAKFLTEEEKKAIEGAAAYLRMSEEQFMRVAGLRLVGQLMQDINAQSKAKEQASGGDTSEVLDSTADTQIPTGRYPDSAGTESDSNLGGSESHEAELQSASV